MNVILFFHVIIMDDLMVYYAQYLNPIFAEKLQKFFLLTFSSDSLYIQYRYNISLFLKLKSLNFPFFLFLSAISLPGGFKDLATVVISRIRAEIEGWYFRGFNHSADCNFSHNCYLSFSVAVQSRVAGPLDVCSSQLTRLKKPVR